MENIKTFKHLVNKALNNLGIEYKSINHIDYDPRGIVVEPVDKDFTNKLVMDIDTKLFIMLDQLFSNEFISTNYKAFIDYKGCLIVWEFKDFFNEIPEEFADYYTIPWCRRPKPTKKIRNKMTALES